MEGLIAQTLKPYSRVAANGLEIKYNALHAVLSLGTCKNRRARAAFPKGVNPADYAPWATWWVRRLQETYPAANLATVESLLSQPLVIDLIDVESDGDSELDLLRCEKESLSLQVAKLQKSNATLSRKKRRLDQYIQQEIRDRVDVGKKLDLLLCRNDGSRYFGVLGGFAMAARRIASNVSARRWGVSAGVDVHHSSVVRWELWLGAAFQAKLKCWYIDRERTFYSEIPKEELEAHPCVVPTRVFRFKVHVHRGDATNTLKLKRKDHTCQSLSDYY